MCMGIRSIADIPIVNISPTPKTETLHINSLMPIQNGHYLPDNILEIIFSVKEKSLILISLIFVPMGPITNKLALAQVIV